MQVLLASFEPRRDRTLAGWRFVRKPTRHASSRQFESQPTKTRGRYEHTLNARPDRSIRQIGIGVGSVLTKRLTKREPCSCRTRTVDLRARGRAR
jgi:hypothetical protein